MKLFVKNDEQPRKKIGCLWKTIIGVGVYFLFCGIFGLVMGNMMFYMLDRILSRVAVMTKWGRR